MRPDIIIIGAGIMGLCTAWQIRRRSNASILVIERGRGLGEGSTGASSAVCRHRYTLDPMVELARDGINAYKDWQAFTALATPRARFHQDGVLWINREGKGWAERERDRMQSLEIEAEVLTHEEVAGRFPALSTCTITPDLLQGTPHNCSQEADFLFETAGGYFEPVDALNDLAEALSRSNVAIQYNSKVDSITLNNGAATGVRLASGETHSSDVVVNASGPWCNEILRPLGLAETWPLKPTRIQILHLDRPPEVIGKIPVCCDLAGGIYFREQNRGQQIVVGSTLEDDEREVVDPDSYANWIDDDFMAAKLHALTHRIPALSTRTRATGYVGLYTVNQTDVHPVVGATPVSNFFVANGFSGHGFKLGPAIGSLLAQTITGEKSNFDTAVPADFLSIDRASLTVDAMNVMA